jgi:hypothetical protein
MDRHRWLAAILVSAAIAACGGPATPDAQAIVGTAVNPGGSAVLGVGMVMFDPLLAPTAAPLIPIGPGMYATGLVPVAANGGFRLPLPTTADLPTGVLVAAEDFLVDLVSLADCALSATVPAARVTAHVFDGESYPGLYAATLDGLRFAVATEGPVDPTDLGAYDGRFLVWLYADRPVALTAVGAGCTGSLEVSLDLASGWNVAGWTFDAGSLELHGAADAASPIVTVVPSATPTRVAVR